MTRTQKSFISLLMAICLVCSMMGSALAAEIQPRYSTLTSANIQLSIDDAGKSTCTAVLKVRNSTYVIEADLTLYRVEKNGMSEVKSWNYTNKQSITANNTYYVVPGNTYQLVADVVVKNASGTVLESTSISSELCSC